jgi:hypothetical protein
VAKKVKKKPEEEESDFEFPEFDEPGFVRHEYEQYYATILAFLIGVGLGGLAYVISSPTLALPVAVPFGAGIGGTAAGALGIRRLRPASTEYTKGDWASLVVLIFFSFLAVWFLLADLIGP